MPTRKRKASYGSWESPITPQFITSSTLGLSSLKLDTDGNLYWLEGRPKEKGRYVVVKRDSTSHAESELTPKDANVRTRVHEYGGGAFVLAPKELGGGVIYSNFACQRLFWSGKHGHTGGPICVTPESDEMPKNRYRYADGEIVRVGREAFELVCVREDHGANGNASPKDVVNAVVAISLDGSGSTRVLATGKDFYLSPRVSSPDNPDVGSRFLTYISYDHPSMPWDATAIHATSFSSPSSPETAAHALIDGDGDTSIMQPAWHASGALYYISDATGYYNLRRVPRIASLDSIGPGAQILPHDGADFGGSSPGWMLGQRGYVFASDGGVLAHVPDRSADGGGTLLVVFDEPSDDPDKGDVAQQVARTKRSFSGQDGLPYFLSNLTPTVDGKTLFMLSGAPDQPVSIASWTMDGGGAPADIIKSSSTADMAALAPFISQPVPITFPSTLGDSHAYYYAPRNDAFTADGAPPLLVKAHGGPTACASSVFNAGIQFWTSRGFAVVDVDYGGSTGYGRDYRRRLRGTWYVQVLPRVARDDR